MERSLRGDCERGGEWTGVKREGGGKSLCQSGPITPHLFLNQIFPMTEIVVLLVVEGKLFCPIA